jgi:hypothetical protein
MFRSFSAIGRSQFRVHVSYVSVLLSRSRCQRSETSKAPLAARPGGDGQFATGRHLFPPGTLIVLSRKSTLAGTRNRFATATERTNCEARRE